MVTTSIVGRLDVLSFGESLLETGDLDPIYGMLRGAELESDLLNRWLIAYWCFYHAGTASRIAEAADFWRTAKRADVERWPRGAERRHFRGAASGRSLDWLSRRFADPTAAVLSLVAPTFLGVSRRVRAWPLFGPWIAFKVADMLERVGGYPVDFGDCLLSVYSEPVEGARLVAAEHVLPEDVGLVAEWLLHGLGYPPAPPGNDRPINIQEAETILCKYKAHRNGHYPVGKDIREIRHGLAAAGPLAARLTASLAPNVTVTS